MAAPRKKLMVAVTSFVCEVKGEQHLIRSGEVLPSTHPAVKQHPELFEAAQEAAA
jgi:hypothetical protein